MTAWLLIGLLALVAATFVAAGFVAAPGRRVGEMPGGQGLAAARERRDAALSGLEDIEEELALGKLGQHDFEALRDQYEAEALAALEELDALERTHLPEDAELEREIADLRAVITCPQCARALGADGTCPHCGSS